MAGTEVLRQIFADQFEPDGEGYLYRKNQRSAPIRVSKMERDHFVANFNRRISYVFWGSIVGGLSLAILPVVLIPGLMESDYSTLYLCVSLGLILLPFLVLHGRMANEPTQALRGRSTIGEKRSPTEIKQHFLAKQTYGQIGAIAVGISIPLIKIDYDRALLSGKNLSWLAFAVFLASCVLFAIWRKWRFDQKNK